MQIIKDHWYDAIFRRHSRRKFNGIPLALSEVMYLTDFASDLNHMVHGARAVVVNKSPDNVLKGAIGSYGKIKGAPAYVAFLGKIDDPHVQEKVGYIGECFILEATAKGLASCWVGGFFKPDEVRQHIEIRRNEQIIAVSPLGYADINYTLEEKIMSGFASGHKRKAIEKLCLDGFQTKWPDWVKEALKLAVLAPSAVNRQPWRFSVENETIKISVDSLRDTYHLSKRLDCGIAMVHIEVGAKHQGIQGAWEYLQHPEVAIFKVER